MNHSGASIKVGISSCLLGDKVRFDGGHKRHDFAEKVLSHVFELVRFCPEVHIGLGIPRQPIRVVSSKAPSNDHQPFRVVGTKDATLDVTHQLVACADEQQRWINDLCGYIVKRDSPSCGMERVKVYRGDQAIRDGSGLYTWRVMQNNPLLPVEEEGRLGDDRLRENFIQRVYVFHRWKQLLEQGISLSRLMDFHGRHKYIIMSHDQTAYRTLGRLLAQTSKTQVLEIANQYITQLMATLKITATRKNHVNVLQHLQGYLKRDIDSDDKQEISEAIERYRQAQLPLIVPISLLKHHFRKYPNDYIDNSFYLSPYPETLGLQNTL